MIGIVLTLSKSWIDPFTILTQNQSKTDSILSEVLYRIN